MVAVILENFTSLGNAIPTLVSPNDIENFREAWAEFDPDADNYMPAGQLPHLLMELPPPLGLRDKNKPDYLGGGRYAPPADISGGLSEIVPMVAAVEPKAVRNCIPEAGFFENIASAAPGRPPPPCRSANSGGIFFPVASIMSSGRAAARRSTGCAVQGGRSDRWCSLFRSASQSLRNGRPRWALAAPACGRPVTPPGTPRIGSP